MRTLAPHCVRCSAGVARIGEFPWHRLPGQVYEGIYEEIRGIRLFAKFALKIVTYFVTTTDYTIRDDKQTRHRESQDFLEHPLAQVG